MKILFAAFAITIALVGSAFGGSEAGKPLTLQKDNPINNYQDPSIVAKVHGLAVVSRNLSG